MARKVKSESRKLREFAAVMTVALGLFGSAIYLWRGHAWGQYLWWAAGVFLVLGLVAPRALRPIERVWMAFAHVLGIVMTTIILTLTFYLVMTPIGLLLRAMGKDLLGRSPDPEAASYWVPAEPDGPGTRPDKPY